KSWYENWFNCSPWLTTLLSTVTGSVVILVLGLTFRPCIFNRLTDIVKGRHLMLARAKYEKIPDNPETEGKLTLSNKEL
ncbi:ENV1 protein, partial [Chloroceryle aenea]|nr:ENV1 protein [Chloroceryle aenea]